MVMLNSLNQYLYSRNGTWYYVRRVPDSVAVFDKRTFSRASLRTKSLEVARVRRDAIAEADDLYWASMLAKSNDAPNSPGNAELKRYKAAKSRAYARGYVYTPVSELTASEDVNELLERVLQVKAAPAQLEEVEATALLGTAEPVAIPISEAYELYCSDLALSDLLGKSEEQKASWRKVKLRAVNNFIALVGDLPMNKITRKHGQQFYKWWGKRLKPSDGKRGLSPSSANRDIGNMRALYRAYWSYEGEGDRSNPFANLNYAKKKYKDIPAFSDHWVRSKILVPGAFGRLKDEAQLIVYALIETGCRPSEIANLTSANIVLDHPVPHLKIRERRDRQLKSNSSVRDIPLVGVALEAMKLSPNGFPHYRDRGSLLSASLLKAFRAHNLMPSPDHRIYSFRHSMEKRMLEADLDYGFRCLMMGHHDSRPQYGDGGSLEFRRDQLLKIVHRYPENIFDTITQSR